MEASSNRINWAFLAAGLLLITLLSTLRTTSQTILDEPKNTYRVLVIAILKRDATQLDRLCTADGKKQVYERLGNYNQIEQSQYKINNWRGFAVHIAERRIKHWQMKGNDTVIAVQEEKDALFWIFTFTATKSGWRLDSLGYVTTTSVFE